MKYRWAAFCLTVVITAAAGSASPRTDPPGAYELLERVRQAYAGLSSYEDAGEIHVLTSVGDEERALTRWFTTAADSAGGFRWELFVPSGGTTERRVLWREGERAFHYDSRRGEVRSAPSVAAELVHGFGDGGYEALAVAVLVAGGGDVLAEPEAASVEGPVSCDAGSCWILLLSRMGGSITSELWVDRETALIQRVDVELLSAAEVLAAASAAAGLEGRQPPPRPAVGPTRIQVLHQIRPGPVEPDRLTFEPPAAARRVEGRSDPVGSMVAASEEDDLPLLGFSDEITVSLFTVEARIIDRRGDPILGLEPDDLKVKVGGRELQVTAVDWIPAAPVSEPEAGRREAPSPLAPGGGDRRSGRSVAIFVQASHEPLVIQGHVKILPSLREMIDDLPAGDRVAVFAYYRRLELLQDLSLDREATAEVLGQAFRPGARPQPRRGANRSRLLSLGDGFDVREAQRATSPERGLQLTAQALAQMPGDKLVIYVGWSLGHLHFREGEVAPDEHYLPALQALAAIDAPVFVLDIMEAGWHALEAGLRGVARDTGGIYLKTAYFPSQATRRLARMISGRYLLTVDRGQEPVARGKLRISLRERRGQILFQPVSLQ